MTEMWMPDCMDAGEYAEWTDANRRLSSKGDRVDRPCSDCLPAFAMEMRGEGRCNGTPMGHVKHEEPVMPEPITSLSTRRLQVAVTAPCPTCAHAAVCRIRPEVEGMRSLQVVQPTLDDAVSLSLSAAVSCAFYVRGRAAKAPTPAEGSIASSSPAGRKLNLSDEERERRRNQALANVAAQRAAREAAAAS